MRLEISPCQLAVAALVAEGLTNREICARLGRRLETVKHHIRAVLDLTGSRNRTELARWYWRTHGERPALRDSLRELAEQDPEGFVELLREVFS